MRPATRFADPLHVIGPELDSLLGVLRDDVNLAVWERSLSASVRHFLQAFMARGIDLTEACSLEVQDEAVALQLPTLTNLAADIPGYSDFMADLKHLISLFSCLVDARTVGVRLRTLEQAMCPRWHVDKVPVRLVSSYVGPGCEWLPEQDVVRQALGSPAVDKTMANARAEKIAEGHVALLKGERWQGNQGRGLVHRSPALQTGQRRLLLTLDWLA
ncbi:MAG: DUF1826 domain-containing protein [Gammaproteobacteria bacterium HGW-Gammaproteobacteria-11]|nr:MAG: DUF1826 domain-containing protein [Gammaproteobacteria bacterium HGW-Gammaproteobacteria-11]